MKYALKTTSVGRDATKSQPYRNTRENGGASPLQVSSDKERDRKRTAVRAGFRQALGIVCQLLPDS